MQPPPVFPKVAPADSWATSWANVMGRIIANEGTKPNPASSHDNIRGGNFSAYPLRPEETIDFFRPFRALYFGERYKPRTTHWPSLSRPPGRHLIRKIP
jgi:hypothetical protein